MFSTFLLIYFFLVVFSVGLGAGAAVWVALLLTRPRSRSRGLRLLRAGLYGGAATLAVFFLWLISVQLAGHVRVSLWPGWIGVAAWTAIGFGWSVLMASILSRNRGHSARAAAIQG